MSKKIDPITFAAETLIDAFIDRNDLHEKGCEYAGTQTRPFDTIDDADQPAIDAWCRAYREYQIKALERALSILKGEHK